jgi:hypothetical protein
MVCHVGYADCDSNPQNGCEALTVYYLDADGDQYGTSATSKQACTQPSGYSTNGGDCYDSNANAHPGQTAYFTTQRGDGSFDYDCDGTADKAPSQQTYLSNCNSISYGQCGSQVCGSGSCSTASAATGGCGTTYIDVSTCNCVPSFVCSSSGSGCTGTPWGPCGFLVAGPGSGSCSGTTGTVACR